MLLTVYYFWASVLQLLCSDLVGGSLGEGVEEGVVRQPNPVAAAQAGPVLGLYELREEVLVSFRRILGVHDRHVAPGFWVAAQDLLYQGLDSGLLAEALEVVSPA